MKTQEVSEQRILQGVVAAQHHIDRSHGIQIDWTNFTFGAWYPVFMANLGEIGIALVKPSAEGEVRYKLIRLMAMVLLAIRANDLKTLRRAPSDFPCQGGTCCPHKAMGHRWHFDGMDAEPVAFCTRCYEELPSSLTHGDPPAPVLDMAPSAA